MAGQEAVLPNQGGELVAILGRVRRRARVFAARDGAVAGAGAGALALALLVVAVRFCGGSVGGAGIVSWLLCFVVAGAVGRAARPIGLSHCARLADAALDGQDEIFCALALARARPRRGTAEAMFVEAAIADAEARARRLAPPMVVPSRRPKHLTLFVGATTALVAVAISVPKRAPAARELRRGPSPNLVPLPAEALAAEREQSRVSAAVARALDQTVLARLAAELDDLVRRLASGEMTDGEAMDHLRALESRARRERLLAEADEAASRAVEEALAASPGARRAGDALARLRTAPQEAPGAEATARAALAGAAAERPADVARAFAAAARGLGAVTAREARAGGESQRAREARRLTRNEYDDAEREAGEQQSGSGSATENVEEERRLERLSRDLERSAEACERGGPSCREGAEQRAGELGSLARAAASTEPLRRFERETRQMRARIARGDIRGASPEASGSESQRDGVRGFGSTLSGRDEEPAGGASTQERGAGATPEMRTGSVGVGGGARDPRQVAPAGGNASGRGEGSGIGSQPGGAPLGAPTQAADGVGADHGIDTEAKVANGTGPTRAQLIAGAAGRGFASPGYARLYADYASVVEDALGETAVPEGRRYYVRRYFDLIRPR